MKKFLLAILAVLAVACLGAAFACAPKNPEGTYYTLVFKQTNGVTYLCDIPSGYEVLEGTEVKFSLKLDENVGYEPDNTDKVPLVYVNDNTEPLQPTDGVYTIVIEQNTEVRVKGLMAQGTEYNKIIFQSAPGVTYNILTQDAEGQSLSSGMMVKYGTEVSFKVTKNEQYSGNMVVRLNGEELTAVDGVYSFNMTEPSVISVDGLQKNITVEFVSADTRVKYIDENGNYIPTDQVLNTYNGQQLVEGTELKFKVQVSVYHVQTGYEVLANSTICTDDDGDGFYTPPALTDDTQIMVTDLIEESSFVERADGGSGTQRDPFRISRPIDLYQMSMLINAGFYTDGRFFAGYYILENDIDLKGEQLYVIGDGSSASGYSIFAGDFNGNGHTISNYVMNDEWIEQEAFSQVYLTNVGLFGLATCVEGHTPSIYNLNIKNATISVNTSRYDDMAALSTPPEVHVGTLIGQSYGAMVSGCTVTDSTIRVDGSMQYYTYAGGLIGVQLSAYSTTGSIRYFSGVTSCSAGVDIQAEVNATFAAGGITGLLAVGEEHLTSYILNSYSTGNINGGMNAGGIVGYAAPGTSVINCYSTGDVAAYSPYNSDIVTVEDLYYANSGGIVGRAGFNTTVYNSFSTGAQSAVSAQSGSRFTVTGEIAGKVEDGDDLQDAHAYPSTIYGSKGVSAAEVTEDFIRNTMKWEEEDWIMQNGMPVFNSAATQKNFTLTFAAEDGFGTLPAPVHVNSQYFSISRWIMSGDMAEYVQGNGGNRSYGYFFDSELNNRIPISFVPTGDMTIYIGYKDYGEVAGVYYLGSSADVGARLEFEEDGSVTYINGALSQNATYTYDGTNIVILNSALGELSNLFTTIGATAREREYYLSSLYNFGATIENGKITITGGYLQEVEISMVPSTDVFGEEIQVEQTSQTGNAFRLFESEDALCGLKKIENFKYIDYFNGNDVYTFNGNGTGVRKNGNVSTSFTYEGTDGTYTVTFSGENNPQTLTVGADGYVTAIGDVQVKAYDGFTGAWERPFAQNVTYTFNGKSQVSEGTWTRSGYFGDATGTYTVENGVLTDAAGAFTATFNDDGMLIITESGVETTYYAGGSFVGEWYYSQRQGTSSSAVTVNLTLKGIGNSGLGSATAVYAATGETVNLTYCSVENNGTYRVEIYNQSTNFATVTYDKTSHLFVGTLNGTPARISATDGLKGLWISGDDTIKEVQFNGRGLYNLSGDAATGALAVNGAVTVNGSNAGKYTLNYADMTGSFTYRSVKYTFKYNISNGAEANIEVTPESGSPFVLQNRDSWYLRQLVDENGLVYTFDGRGELASGGTVTATDGDMAGGVDHYRQYTYTIDGENLILVSKESSYYKGGRISRGDNGNGKTVFMFAEEGAASPKVLTYYTPFTGEWIIGGEMGELTIGTVYADGSADGSYKFYGDEEKTDVTFRYNYVEGNLTFPYGKKTYYVNALVYGDSNELSVGPENNTTGSTNSVCIPKSKADAYYGKTYKVYNAETKEDSGETLVFDGLSSSVFSSGTAVLYSAQGKVSEGYGYTVDEQGNVRIIYGNNRYVMVSWEKDSQINYTAIKYVHSGDDYYAILYPDSLYGLTVKDAAESGVTYAFDGVGGVVRHNADGSEQIFKYYVLLADNVTNRHVIRFTDSEGKIYSVTLDQAAQTVDGWTVKMQLADDYFEINAVDANSSTASFFFDGAGRVIRLTTDTAESPANYTYEFVSKDGNIATFTFTDTSGRKYTAVLDMSSGNSDEYKLTLTAQD